MTQDVDAIVKEALAAFAGIDDAAGLERAKARYLGRSGALTQLLKGLGKLSATERPAFGSRVNSAKEKLEAALAEQRGRIESRALEANLRQEALDVTLPGRGLAVGGLHPVTRTMERIEALFRSLGFDVADGPEIETDYYNFTALNQPENHPARSMHDTFYLADGRHLLRTHTSPVQVRYMENHRPPLRIIAPGRVYRCDSDVTHTPMFHQIEGLAIDRAVTMADLKSCLFHFAHAYFGPEAEVRLRPSYFPFTEPSAEMDVECLICGGSGCGICKQSGWLEVMGCGMVHPGVLEHGGIDPKKYSGWAFGLGVERFVMLKHGIHNIRHFYENDVRFLRQF